MNINNDPKAVGTQVSGALSKELTAAFQDITIGDTKDCGTELYLEFVLDKWIAKDILYRYIKDGSKLVLLTDQNINSYIGKKIKLRSIMFCKSKKVCKTCAGQMYEKLGIKNIGLTTTRVSSTLLNMNMKKFHDSTVSINPIDLDTIQL